MSEKPGSFEAVPSPEARAFATMEVLSRKLIAEVSAELEINFGPNGRNYEYHNLAHTKRAAALYETFGSLTKKYNLVSDAELLAGRLAIWFHDSVMEAEVITPENQQSDSEVVGARRRAIGYNERSSYTLLSNRLDLFVTNERNTSDDDTYVVALAELVEQIKIIAEEAIMATQPQFALAEITRDTLSQSTVPKALQSRLYEHLLQAPPQGKAQFLKISQKNLNPNSSMTAFNVASADLSQVGEMTSEEFAKSGDSELWESKPYIRQAFQDIDTIDDPEQLIKLAGTVLDWVDTQPGFLYWQWQQASDYLRGNAARFESQLSRVGHDVPAVLQEFQAILPQFEPNLKASLNRAYELRSAYNDLTQASAFTPETRRANRQRLLTLISLTNPARV